MEKVKPYTKEDVSALLRDAAQYKDPDVKALALVTRLRATVAALETAREALRWCVEATAQDDCIYCGARHINCACDAGTWWRNAQEALK